VNIFYDEKALEYRQRLDVLVDSVGDKKPKGDRRTNSHRLGLTDREGLGKLKDVLQRRLHNDTRSVPPDEETTCSGQLGDFPSDDEPEMGKVDKKQQKKEADSIKRELMDLHRRTTLLLNFSIMNYTGFVKIIKKFNKTFPEQKGQHSELLEKDNICHEGKDAEQLVSKMVRPELTKNFFRLLLKSYQHFFTKPTGRVVCKMVL